MAFHAFIFTGKIYYYSDTGINPFTALYNARNMPGENTAILMFLWCYV